MLIFSTGAEYEGES